MEIDVSPNRSSRQPQADITADRTQQPNIVATNNLSATPSVTHVMESDSLDARHHSSLIGESIEDQLQAWLKEAQRRQDIERSQESASTSQRVKHYQNIKIPTRKSVNGQNLNHRPLQENTPVKSNALVEHNAPSAFVTGPQVEEEPSKYSKSDLSLTVPQPTLPPPHPPHAPSPPSPGFIDPLDGVYREWQKEDLCGLHASNTVRVALGKKPRTQEKYEKKVPNQDTTRKDLVDFADEDGFDTKVYHIAQFGGASIDGIEDVKEFVIMKPGFLDPSRYHIAAIVYSKIKKGYCLSDSDDQNKREIYYGTANEALHEYQRRNNIIVRAVITYQERTSVHSRKFIAKNFYDESLKLYGSSSWKEGIEASNEVITRLWDEEKRSQRWLLAEALLDKAFALGKLDLPVESIALYDTVIERFRKAEDPGLRMFAIEARRHKAFAISQ